MKLQRQRVDKQTQSLSFLLLLLWSLKDFHFGRLWKKIILSAKALLSKTIVCKHNTEDRW